MTITSQSLVYFDPDTHEWCFEDGRRIPVFAGGDDGDFGGASDPGVGQPAGDDDPGQQDGDTPSQPSKAKEKGAAPWAQDLEALRDHDDPFAAFDEYLRTKVQPRMTQHEQSVAEFNKMFGDVDTARMVSEFMTTLDGNPKETLRQLATTYGVDPLDLLEELEDQAKDASPDAPEENGKTPDFEDEDRKWVQQRRTEEQQQKQDAALENLLTGFEDEIPGFDRDLYVYMLKASDFDAEEALETYMKWHKAPEDKPDAPPTAGGQKGATPREAPKHKSIGDALQAFFRDDQAAKA